MTVYFLIVNFENLLEWNRRRWERTGTRGLLFCIYYCFAGCCDHNSGVVVVSDSNNTWCTTLVTDKLAKENVQQRKKKLSFEQPLQNRRRLKSNGNCGSERNLVPWAPWVLLHLILSLPLPQASTISLSLQCYYIVAPSLIRFVIILAISYLSVSSNITISFTLPCIHVTAHA